MDEKKELLRLTNKRWSLLRRRIGRNIIDYIQKISPKKKGAIELTDEQQIDEILEDAGAFGLRYEVELYAEELLEGNPALSRLDAYVMAYHDWIK